MIAGMPWYVMLMGLLGGSGLGLSVLATALRDEPIRARRD